MMNKRHHRFICLVTGIIGFWGILGVNSLTSYADSAESAYSVSANIPEEQTNKDVSYFDLTEAPNETRDLSIHLSNVGEKESVFEIEINNAATNTNGVIDYNQRTVKKDASAKYQGSDCLTTDAKEVTIPAGEAKDVHFQLKMPKESFDGILLGGIHVTKKENQSEKVSGTAIRNKYAYVIGVELRNNSKPVSPDLKLISVRTGLQNSYATIFITIIGTVIGVFLMSTFAYTLSRKTYAYRGFLSRYSLIPMLFSGGMIGNYIVVVNVLGLRNSIWALILPLCMSTFSIMVLKTFYQMSVPEALIESVYIDGASEWLIYFKIVLPLSLPGIATIALFLTLGYWNDWFSALLYTDNNQLVPLQYLLMKMENNIEFIANNAGKMGMTQTGALPTETIKMAVVVVATLPILIAYPFFQKYFIGGLTVGAVKE